MTNEQLIEEIKNGVSVTADMERLYMDNLPLIKRFIRPYAGQEPEEDLLQEAYLGMQEAVEHYDPSQGVLFMTYARYWIRQRVRRYLEECGRLVKLPSHYWQEIGRYKKAVQAYQQIYSREPTDQDMADFMGISVKEVQAVRFHMAGIQNIDAPVDEEGDLCLSDTLQSDLDLESSTIDRIYEGYQKNELWGIVERYTDSQQAEVVRQHFQEGRTIANIARISGQSPQAVRMQKDKALKRLRTGRARRELEEKLEVLEGCLYRTGIGRFRDHGDTSMVEHLAMRRMEIEEGYKQVISG